MTELKKKVEKAVSRTGFIFKEARKTLIIIWGMILVTIIVRALLNPEVIGSVATSLTAGLGVILSAIALIIKSDFRGKK